MINHQNSGVAYFQRNQCLLRRPSWSYLSKGKELQPPAPEEIAPPFHSGPCEYLLVGGIPTPLKNMKVSWDYHSQYMEKWKMLQTTNQIYWNVMRLRWIHAYRERAPHATCTQMPADAGRLGIRTMQQNHQLSIFAPAGLSQLVVLDLGTATWSSSHWKSSSIRLRHLIPPNSEWQKPLKICLNCGPFKGFKIKVPSYWYNQSRESATPGVSPRSLICFLASGFQTMRYSNWKVSLGM